MAAGAAPSLGVAGEGASGGAGVGGSAGEAAAVPIAPAGLTVAPHASGCGVLELSALTLQAGSIQPELFVALENKGAMPACSPAFSYEIFDHSEQSVAAGVGGLLVKRFFRMTDGADTLAACVAPGDITLIAIEDLPVELELEDVARVEYWCSFWALDVTPVGSLTVSSPRPVLRADGVAYAGELTNELDVPLQMPSVSVFQLDAEGRPLGVALASGDGEVAPGDRWSFETESVTERGVTRIALPTHGPS